VPELVQLDYRKKGQNLTHRNGWEEDNFFPFPPLDFYSAKMQKLLFEGDRKARIGDQAT